MVENMFMIENMIPGIQAARIEEAEREKGKMREGRKEKNER